MGKVFGILGLIFGIVSIALCWIFFLGIPLGALGIIFGGIGIAKDDSKGLGIAGLILGIIGLVLSILFITVLAIFIAGIYGGLFGGGMFPF
ncbi:MAG: DUF4190 domain-containing protein [Promethearchaeota archaeon]